MASLSELGAVVVRRASASSRDVRAVTDLLTAAGLPPGEALASALADDRWGIVLLAERRGGRTDELLGAPLGVSLLRWWGHPGGGHDRSLIEALWVTVAHRRQGLATALAHAARIESEARGVTDVRLAVPHDDPGAMAFARSAGFTVSTGVTVYAHGPATAVGRATAPASPVAWLLAPGVHVALDPSMAVPPTVTLWSGALAFRTRWTTDRNSPLWTTEGCTGSRDDGGDVLRFDPVTRQVRESWLARPTAVRIDPGLLDAITAAPVTSGVLVLPVDTPVFAMVPTVAAVFDLPLGCYAAVTLPLSEGGAEALAATGPLHAVAVSPHASLLFSGGRYVGWRVLDPVSHARPMGWPEPRTGVPPTGTHRSQLTALLYDWMTLDAAPRVRPDEAMDPDDIAHLVGVRERARTLAAERAPDDDPTPGVARDIAAHVHWSWGFFRLGE